MIAPMLVGVMIAQAFPLPNIFLMFASVFVLISVTVVLLGKESKRRTLEELEHSLG